MVELFISGVDSTRFEKNDVHDQNSQIKKLKFDETLPFDSKTRKITIQNVSDVINLP